MKKLVYISLIASLLGCSENGQIGKEFARTDKNYPVVEEPERVEVTPDFTYHKKATGFILPEEFKVPAKEFTVNPGKASQVKVNAEGTTLYIPENAFVDKNGNPVTGAVSISFREYTNPAEIAFSFLPMTYKADGTEYNFNSAGMFEITGRCGEEPVNIANGKQIKVDYHLAQKTPDMAFFTLDKKTNEWKRVQDIPKVQPQDMNVKQENRGWVKGKVVQNQVLMMDSIIWYNDTFPNTMLLVRKTGKVRENILVVKDPSAKGGLKVVGEVKQVPRKVFQNGFEGSPNENDKRNGSLLASGMDAGHTYPDIVKGLNVESFGVYNCDQIYRVGQPVNIMASWKDESGNAIKDPTVLSMIDLQYNGAFSFYPSQFMCNASGRNVLLLFTKTGKLYMLGEAGFKTMNITANGSYAFTMKDVTEKIKGTKDLAAELGIKM